MMRLVMMCTCLALVPAGLASEQAGTGDEASTVTRQLTRAVPTEAGALVEDTTTGNWRALWALGIVLLVIIGAAWVAKRTLPAGRLGGGTALQVISRTHLSAKQSLTLVRAGNRLVMLGVTPEHISTLATFDDPGEMAALMTSAAPQRSGFAGALSTAERDFDAVEERPGEVGLEASRHQVTQLIDRIRGMAATGK